MVYHFQEIKQSKCIIKLRGDCYKDKTTQWLKERIAQHKSDC